MDVVSNEDLHRGMSVIYRGVTKCCMHSSFTAIWQLPRYGNPCVTLLPWQPLVARSFIEALNSQQSTEGGLLLLQWQTTFRFRLSVLGHYTAWVMPSFSWYFPMPHFLQSTLYICLCKFLDLSPNITYHFPILLFKDNCHGVHCTVDTKTVWAFPKWNFCFLLQYCLKTLHPQFNL